MGMCLFCSSESSLSRVVVVYHTWVACQQSIRESSCLEHVDSILIYKFKTIHSMLQLYSFPYESMEWNVCSQRIPCGEEKKRTYDVQRILVQHNCYGLNGLRVFISDKLEWV